MSDPAPAKAKSSAKPKKSKAPKTHPPVSEMVNAAIESLKERKGSSLQAIKKYLSTQYKVDVERLSPFIRRYLRGAVAKGELLQTSGKGASGSFKIASTVAKKEKVVTKSIAKKPKAAGSPTKIKKPAAKVAKPKVAPKKSAAAKPKKATAAKKIAPKK